ncbi:DUF1636 domain-containing protein [Roseovarius sp. D0-M9]|uniref:DUF1636 domain-containing protein n=1 Tax=Roseovarius sp. D0-M9 TaxID=3127117 RepID=UPI00300FAA3C
MKDQAEVETPHLPTELLVCVKCRRGHEISNEERRPGKVLFDTLGAMDLPGGLRVTAVECLSNCSQGCTVALRGAGRWTYIYGNLDEESQAETILEIAAQYNATADGLVPWRQRPEHIKRNCVARIPPLEI